MVRYTNRLMEVTMVVEDTTIMEDITTTTVITTVSTTANITMAITAMKLHQELGGKKH